MCSITFIHQLMKDTYTNILAEFIPEMAIGGTDF